MYASIDIGGTNTRIGLSDTFTELGQIYRFKTPKTIEKLHEKLHSILSPHSNDLNAISVAVPGLINRIDKKLVLAPNVPYFKNMLVNQIVPGFSCPILLENDTALAGLAESNHASLSKYDRIAYITLSTGVGGSLIINNSIHNTTYNFEPGHIIINFDKGIRLKGVYPGTFEIYCSGAFFEEVYGQTPDTCEDKQIWEKYGKYLAISLVNIAILWQTDVIVLGGSLSKKSSFYIHIVNNVLKDKLEDLAPIIKISTLDDTNVMIGGLLRIKQRMNAINQ